MDPATNPILDDLDSVRAQAVTFLLTAENRGPAFGPEQPVSEGAGPYERIAAYAGRRVG